MEKPFAVKRITLEVYVDLDAVPGEFHDKESARSTLQQILKERIPHYRPVVATTNHEAEYELFRRIND